MYKICLHAFSYVVYVKMKIYVLACLCVGVLESLYAGSFEDNRKTVPQVYTLWCPFEPLHVKYICVYAFVREREIEKVCVCERERPLLYAFIPFE